MGGPAVGEALTQLIRDGEILWEGSITDFLRGAPDYQRAMAVYEKALRDAKGASLATKRKWRSIVDEKPGVIS